MVIRLSVRPLVCWGGGQVICKGCIVGWVSCGAGNLPHILGRVIAQKQALGAVLDSGLARAHRGNPAAGLKDAKLQALPVLLSGIGAQEFGSKLVHENLFRVTRTWCYCLHRDRLRILGRWKHY